MAMSQWRLRFALVVPTFCLAVADTADQEVTAEQPSATTIRSKDAHDSTKCEEHRTNNSIFVAKVRDRLRGGDKRLPPIRVIPYPHLKATLGHDPLPIERTWRRLEEDGITDAALYVKKEQQNEAYRRRIDAYRQQTLVIEWDGAPDSRWALNVEGALTSLPRHETRIPPGGWDRHRWERQGDRSCALVYENENPTASLRVAFQAQHDHVDYALTLQIDDDQQRWRRMVTHLCFNHCWAAGFGRDARVRIDNEMRRLGGIPNPHRIWIRVATLSDNPAYAQLKREQFSHDGIGGNLNNTRLTGREAVTIKIPLGGVQGKFIASQRKAGRPATVAINSPNAISVGWSFWPCTDIDLAFGTIRPRQPKTVSGRIYFLHGTIEESLNTIQIAD